MKHTKFRLHSTDKCHISFRSPVAYKMGLLLCTAVLSVENSYAGAADDPLLYLLQVDQLEISDGQAERPVALDAQGWVGYDLNKFWIKADAEYVDSQLEEAELQLLLSRAVAPFWDFQFGIRRDFKPSPKTDFAVLGFQGLAPYYFEIDAALFVDESGQSSIRFEAEYEFLFTQKLILTPEVTINIAGYNDEISRIGSGLSSLEMGLRLRYEIVREFAPYIGINWNESYGRTANILRNNAEDTAASEALVGIKVWY